MELLKKIDPALLTKGLRGLERENLRLGPQGHLSKRSHEEILGLSANDPVFTLDFAECQLELVTPTFRDLPTLMAFLKETEQMLVQKLGDETLWPYSMPPFCTEAEIEIAYFGMSEAALKKRLYRQGLIHRYGKIMQIICGIHYNFSFHEDFFKVIGQDKNTVYFKIIRNFWRFYPLLIYLFGASPFYFAQPDKPTIEPYATSLRQSERGYHNPDVPELRISYDDFCTYLASLKKATSTIYPPYLAIPKDQQLNAYYLQIQNEHYAPIRPKAKPALQDRSMIPLCDAGVHYIEIRTLDLNPLLPLGVDIDTLAFIDLFLLYCFCTPEAPFDFVKYKNRALEIAKFGRKDDRIVAEGLTILQEIKPILTQINLPLYEQAWQTQYDKLLHPEKLPSALVLEKFRKSV